MFDSDARKRFRQSRVGPVGLALVSLMLAVALLGPVVASTDPNQQSRDTMLDDMGMPVAPFTQPGHPLGADPLGRDELARLLHGGRISMGVGLGATAVAATIGVFVGVVSGFLGGVAETVLIFLVDVMLSMPFLLVAMCLRRVIPEANAMTLVTLLGLLSWPGLARIVRASTLKIRELDYVTAARAMGASRTRIVATHLLPNLAGPIIAMATSLVSSMLLSESALSFLGLGVAPPHATWGAMLSESQAFLFDAPRLFIFPATLLVLSILGFNLLGQGLRDALDPKE